MRIERVAKLELYLNEALRTCLVNGQEPSPELCAFLEIDEIKEAMSLPHQLSSRALAARTAAEDGTEPEADSHTTTDETLTMAPSAYAAAGSDIAQTAVNVAGSTTTAASRMARLALARPRPAIGALLLVALVAGVVLVDVTLMRASQQPPPAQPELTPRTLYLSRVDFQSAIAKASSLVDHVAAGSHTAASAALSLTATHLAAAGNATGAVSSRAARTVTRTVATAATKGRAQLMSAANATGRVAAPVMAAVARRVGTTGRAIGAKAAGAAHGIWAGSTGLARQLTSARKEATAVTCKVATATSRKFGGAARHWSRAVQQALTNAFRWASALAAPRSAASTAK